jgi:hypothetical protein
MEDIATKFEADVSHCVRNVKEKNVLLFKFRCKIFNGVKIIKETPRSAASRIPCIILAEKTQQDATVYQTSIILYFKLSSTCFGRHTVHHQEPKTALVASGFA